MVARALVTLRSRLLLLVLAFAAPMLGLEAWRAVAEHGSAITAAEDQMLQLARTAAAREDDSLQEAANLLRVLVHVPDLRNGELSACHALLREIVNEHPRIDFDCREPPRWLGCLPQCPAIARLGQLL